MYRLDLNSSRFLHIITPKLPKKTAEAQRQSWKLALSGKLVGRDLALRNSQDLFSPRNTTKNFLLIVDLDLILNKLQIQTQILLFSEAFCMFNTCLMSTRKTAVLLSVSASQIETFICLLVRFMLVKNKALY